MASPAPIKIPYTWENGFYPSQEEYDGIPGTARDGLGVWLRGRIVVSDRGYSVAASNSNSGGATPLMLVGNGHGGMTGGLGTVTLHFGVPWFAGSGNGIVDGSSIGAASGSLYLRVAGVTYAAGLSKPAAPTWTVAVTAGRLNGSTSIRIAKFRATTGAISNASDPSAAMVAKNKKGIIGAIANPNDGTTHWLVFGSRNNFGGVGPWFRATNVAAIAVGTLAAGPVEIDFTDGNLGDLAPTTNDPAPATLITHCAALGGVMIAISSNGMCYPSKVGFPEAFDLALAIRLASGQAPTGVTSRGAEGGVFVSTRDSISLLILSGSPDVPILARGVFEGTGVAHGNAMCWVYDALYGMGSTGGPFRSQGGSEPDTSFALPMMKYFLDNGFTSANTFVVHDERNGCVLYCSGNRAAPFMLATQRWSTPMALAGTAGACVAIAGAAEIAVGSTLYTLDTAAGNPVGGAFLQSPWFGADGRIITLEEFYSQGKDDCTLDLLKDLTATTVGGKFPLSFIAPHGTPKVQKINRRVRSVAFKASTALGNKSLPKAQAVGTVEPAAA